MMALLMGRAGGWLAGGAAVLTLLALWQWEVREQEELKLYIEALQARETAVQNALDRTNGTINALRQDMAKLQEMRTSVEAEYARILAITAKDIQNISENQERHKNVSKKKPVLVGRAHDRATAVSLRRLSEATCRTDCANGNSRANMPDPTTTSTNSNASN